MPNAMRGDGVRPDPPKKKDHREEGEVHEQKIERGGRTEAKDIAHEFALKARGPERDGDAPERAAPNKRERDEDADALTDDRPEGGALHAKAGQAELPINQDPIERDVQPVDEESEEEGEARITRGPKEREGEGLQKIKDDAKKDREEITEGEIINLALGSERSDDRRERDWRREGRERREDDGALNRLTRERGDASPLPRAISARDERRAPDREAEHRHLNQEDDLRREAERRERRLALLEPAAKEDIDKERDDAE